jgi:poly(A) polymerase
METPQVKAVFQALGAPSVDVRFVGGCVRDSLLGRDITDIDIATPDAPAVVIEKLETAGLKAVPTGLAHGTVTALAGGQSFEITTLRKDTACDGRHAAVEFTADWAEDASRRDFTFNAMSQQPDGTLFDPYDGVTDAYAGRVRFVGNPRDRIQEDYLRILRYFRFLAHYGKAAPEDDVLAACNALRAGLAKLSTERVRDELIKLFSASDPRVAIAAMTSAGVLHQVMPGIGGQESLSKLIEVERALEARDGESIWHRRWVALIDTDPVSVARGMKVSGKDVTCIKGLTAAAAAAPGAFEPPDLYRFLYAYANRDQGDRHDSAAAGGTLIACACSGGEVTQPWRDLFEHVLSWGFKPFPLSGRDVQALGVPEGPRVGELLDNLRSEWVDGGFKMTAADMRARLKMMAK